MFRCYGGLILASVVHRLIWRTSTDVHCAVFGVVGSDASLHRSEAQKVFHSTIEAMCEDIQTCVEKTGKIYRDQHFDVSCDRCVCAEQNSGDETVRQHLLGWVEADRSRLTGVTDPRDTETAANYAILPLDRR
ncbi:hypothetical protein KCU61_g520, partial [Aureobasidium melanogenum]